MDTEWRVKERELTTMKSLPVMKSQCATCPFRQESQYAYLSADLATSALSEASRICHSTGSNNAINKRTGKPPMICRGARNLQLRMFAAIGFLNEPTDEAWNRKYMEVKNCKPKAAMSDCTNEETY